MNVLCTGVVIGGESSSHLRDQVMPVLADLTVKTEIHSCPLMSPEEHNELTEIHLKLEPLAKTLGTWEHPDFREFLTLMKKGMTENV